MFFWVKTVKFWIFNIAFNVFFMLNIFLSTFYLCCFQSNYRAYRSHWLTRKLYYTLSLEARKINLPSSFLSFHKFFCKFYCFAASINVLTFLELGMFWSVSKFMWNRTPQILRKQDISKQCYDRYRSFFIDHTRKNELCHVPHLPCYRYAKKAWW